MKKKAILSLLIAIAFLTAQMQGGNYANAAVKSRASVKNEKLTFSGLGSGGALLFTIVEVYIKDTEYYTTSGQKVTYVERSVYGYAKKITSNLGSISYLVVPPYYVNKNNDVIRKFSYKSESNIFPICDYWEGVKNEDKVTYPKNNSNISRCKFIISVDDALVPTKALSTSLTLRIKTK